MTKKKQQPPTVEEETEAFVAALPSEERVSTLVEYLCDLIRQGVLDDHLELILAEGHDRKRARRGTLGFPREAS